MLAVKTVVSEVIAISYIKDYELFDLTVRKSFCNVISFEIVICRFRVVRTIEFVICSLCKINGHMGICNRLKLAFPP